MTRAAVLRAVGDQKLDVTDVELAETGPRQVRLRVHATGVCHSDLSAMNGVIPQPAPFVPGHEGAGEIVEIGPGVDEVAVGDHVIVAWMPPCGRCRYCLGGQPQLCLEITAAAGYLPRFTVGGEPAFGMAGTGTFAEEVVLPVEAVVKIAEDVPWDVASLIGCGVTTGVGAVINSAHVTPGASVIVFGCGGVGINVVQGARLVGAAEIVAVDLVESKREIAREFGATHAVHPDDVPGISAELTAGQGFDYGFEVIGLPTTIRATYDAVRRGGTATIVGVGAANQIVEFNAFELFFNEKRLVGTTYGSADVRTEFHRLIKLWRHGRLDLEGLISKTGTLDDVNQALEDMQAGRVIRTVISLNRDRVAIG
ncbi:MAG: Zn-dependent alcohol dehydrogenase [Acidimicrobiales bacterium]